MTNVGTMKRKMDRRDFLRSTLAAAAGAALLLAGCGAPAADGPAADTAVAVDRTQDQEDIAPQPTAQPLEQEWGVACPAGLVNDPYPGRCKHYVDRNGNGVCDRSEPGSGDYPPRT
jgi:hypothetical protein